MGGGHGLAVTLRATRRYARRVTAVVAVADDGGSSGRLREAMALPAPGDVRRCLVALADPPTVLSEALGHRFRAGDLDGHAVGNLLIAGLTAVTGDFVSAVDEVGRLLGLGPPGAPPDEWPARVLPATTTPVVLTAETATGVVRGQVAVKESTGIRRLALDPPSPPAPLAAISSIAAADQIVIGSCSLFTSVLAAAAVPGIAAALASAPALTVYVCNLGGERHETEGFDVADHVDALTAHGVRVDRVLCQPGSLANRGAARPIGAPCVEVDVARDDGRAHDPTRLAAALAALA
ncbi:hypothetical protein BH24ACT3_BH24ACT3_02530 [soil metagenome]